LTGGVLVAAAAAVLGRILAPGAVVAIWWGAGLAYAVQVVAFGVLVAVRRRGMAFLAAWGGGTLLRMAVVLVAGVWLTRAAALAPAPLLLSLAGFLFVLLLLEPVFFRVGMRS
jgi:hypothetical protein